MSENDHNSAEAVALAGLRTAENISRMMFEAVEAQQVHQQAQLQETAAAIAKILAPGQD
ncbi:hypothetical protein [Mameliella sp.]|uniref:hypothetical protein n=1 Tax=Mameliella sp. TaxID=1924940 RepID=UPI003B505CA4